MRGLLLALLAGLAWPTNAQPARERAIDLTLPFTGRAVERQGGWCLLSGDPVPREGGAIVLARSDGGRLQLGLVLPRGVIVPAGQPVRLQLRVGERRLGLDAAAQADGRLLAEVPQPLAALLAPPARTLLVALQIGGRGWVRYRLDEAAGSEARFRDCLAHPAVAPAAPEPAAPPSPVPDAYAPPSLRKLEQWRIDDAYGCSMIATGDGARAAISLLPLSEGRQVGTLQITGEVLAEGTIYEIGFRGTNGGFRLSAEAHDNGLAAVLRRDGQEEAALGHQLAEGGFLELNRNGRIVAFWRIAPAPVAIQRGLQRCLATQAPL